MGKLPRLSSVVNNTKMGLENVKQWWIREAPSIQVTEENTVLASGTA